jgi:NAD(P)-dependent dehydrogenase (short-subunit alcohol dehydrogenase family)
MKDGDLLHGQVAIVTGAGRGVGRAIAEGLAAAGAAVAVAARSEDEIDEVAAAIGAGGGRAEALRTDVTDGAIVDTLVRETETRLGPPTLLVNNAGTWRHIGPLASANADDWWEDVEVSVKGTFLCTRAVLPGMLERGSGRIVNVASYAAAEPRPYATAYATAKAAVLRLTDSLAAELDAQGVLVFAVTPGFVRTRLVDDAASSRAGRTYLPELETRGDALDPQHAARLVVEIASGRLDPLAGRLLHVLEDLDALLLRADEIRAGGFYTLRLRTLPPPAQ